MRTKSIYPRQIERMIKTGYSRGWKANRIADYINSSRSATKANYTVTPRSVAAKMANFTRDRA